MQCTTCQLPISGTTLFTVAPNGAVEAQCCEECADRAWALTAESIRPVQHISACEERGFCSCGLLPSM